MKFRPVRSECSFSLGIRAPGKHGRINQGTESILEKLLVHARDLPGTGQIQCAGRPWVALGSLLGRRWFLSGPRSLWERGASVPRLLYKTASLFGGIHRRFSVFAFPEAGDPRSFQRSPGLSQTGYGVSAFPRGPGPRSLFRWEPRLPFWGGSIADFKIGT